MQRRTVLLVVAIVAAVFALVASEGDGEVILTALGWLSVSVGCVAAALLP